LDFSKPLNNKVFAAFKLPRIQWPGIKRGCPIGSSPKVYAMSRVCQVTGKGPKTGNTVSHANNRKRRRFLPNLHTHRFWLETEKRFVSLRVSTRGLRTIEKRGVETVVADLRAQGVKV
jgi:large subunit ribosomal protein L28